MPFEAREVVRILSRAEDKRPRGEKIVKFTRRRLVPGKPEGGYHEAVYPSLSGKSKKYGEQWIAEAADSFEDVSPEEVLEIMEKGYQVIYKSIEYRKI